MPEFRALIPGGGEMGERIRAFDWAGTPLGSPARWPQSLRSALSICLNSSFPTAIYWGRDFRLLYNDPWAPIPGPRHPDALGQAAEEVWSDIWHIIGPQLKGAYDTGRGFSTAEQMLPMTRHGRIEETYWDYMLTPVAGEDGRVAGLLNQGQDATARVFAGRCTALLLKITDLAAQTRSTPAMIDGALALLGAEFGCGRVGFGEVDQGQGAIRVDRCWTDGTMPTLTGTIAAGAFGEPLHRALSAGRTVTIGDTEVPGAIVTEALRPRYAAVGMRSGIAVPLMGDGGYRALLFAHAAAPRSWSSHHQSMAVAVAERLWSELWRNRSAARLRDSEERHRLIFEQAQDIIFTADLQQRLTAVNPAGAAALGTTPDQLAGRTISEFIPAKDFERSSAMLSRKLREGGTTRYEVDVIVRADEAPRRWEVSSTLAIGHEGEPIGLHGIARDVTERHAFEQSQQVLINELNHRVKNTLAIVQGLAAQSFRPATDPHVARDAFQARLAALAAAHDRLVDERWDGATFGQLVADATRAHADRIDCAGPSVRLAPKAAVSLVLAFHELADNAVHYGALSVPEGRVTIRWQVTEAGRLAVEWRETGGPAVAQPARRGFGLKMVERALAADLGGTVRLEFAEAGVVCLIDAALPEALGEDALARATEPAA